MASKYQLALELIRENSDDMSLEELLVEASGYEDLAAFFQLNEYLAQPNYVDLSDHMSDIASNGNWDVVEAVLEKHSFEEEELVLIGCINGLIDSGKNLLDKILSHDKLATVFEENHHLFIARCVKEENLPMLVAMIQRKGVEIYRMVADAIVFYRTSRVVSELLVAYPAIKDYMNTYLEGRSGKDFLYHQTKEDHVTDRDGDRFLTIMRDILQSGGQPVMILPSYVPRKV